MAKDWRKEDYHQIILEGIKATRIQYLFGDSFFTPKLRSINHMTVGDSKMIHNPITIILEFLYLQFKKIRNWWQHFKKGLYPRRDIIYGTKKDSQLVGRMTFESRYDHNKPIHHMYCEFWSRRRFGQWRKLGQTYTDKDGYFEIDFDLRVARSSGNRRLYLDIFQVTEVFYNEKKPQHKKDLFKRIRVKKNNLVGMRYSLRDIQLFFWEYRHDTNVPRAAIRDHDRDAPQHYSQKRVDAFAQQIIPIELTRVKHLAQIKTAPGTISMESINNDYPINLTRYLEKEYPGFTRSDEYFGTRMMNGMNRGAFLPDKDNPEHYWMKYFGIYGYEGNSKYALPTTEIKYELEKHGYPIPIEIHFTGPLNAFEKDPFAKKVVTRADGDVWEYAKRMARVAGSFTCEVDEHFAGTHLVAEQYAIAAYRNLRLNPVASLLFPHLKEVILINHSADGFLLTEFIPTASAITKKGMLARTKDLLGVQDWKNWTPMEPISDAHSCAKADQLFWQVTSDYVELFFREHREDIEKHWLEIHRFSEDLINKAVPVLYSDIDIKALPENDQKLIADKMKYYCFKYRFDKDAKREEINGKIKAVSAITKKEDWEKGMEEDWENLKQVCKYAIMVATYLHTWINEHQYDELGEVLYNCGGLRFGKKESGVLAPESDLSIAPDLTTATTSLWFANILSRTEYGFIVNNEEKDIHPEYVELLKAQKEAFEALNVDIKTIESRTNI